MNNKRERKREKIDDIVNELCSDARLCDDWYI